MHVSDSPSTGPRGNRRVQLVIGWVVAVLAGLGVGCTDKQEPTSLDNGGGKRVVALESGRLAVADEVLVSADDLGDGDPQRFAEAVDGTVIGVDTALGLVQIRVDDPVDASKRLQRVAGVEMVSPHPVVELRADGGVPPSDAVERNWHLDLIDAEGARELVPDASDVTVAVIEPKGVGRHRGLEGAGLEDGDEAAHGTHVAGLACGRDIGVGNGCRVQAFDHEALAAKLQAGDAGRADDPTTTPTALGSIIDVFGRALVDALGDSARGARVVNMSFSVAEANVDSGPKCLKAEGDTDFALGVLRKFVSVHPDVLFVHSAGNQSCGNFGDLLGQAWADAPNVLDVAAVNSDRSIAYFSNYGDHVDVAAPGAALVDDLNPPLTSKELSEKSAASGPWSYKPCSEGNCEDAFVPMAGTSMAAPLVTGTAALAMQANPDIAIPELRACLVAPPGPPLPLMFVGEASVRDTTAGWQLGLPPEFVEPLDVERRNDSDPATTATEATVGEVPVLNARATAACAMGRAPDVTEEALRNVELPADSCAAPFLRLSDGRAEGQADGGSLEVTLEPAVLGDVTGDGITDGVAVVTCVSLPDGAVAGRHVSEVHLLAAGAPGPARVQGVLQAAEGAWNPWVDGVTIEKGHVWVQSRAHLPDDSYAGGSLDVSEELAWDGSALRVVNRTTRGPQQVTEEFVDALNRHDDQVLDALTSPEWRAQLELPAGELGGPWEVPPDACFQQECVVVFTTAAEPSRLMLRWLHTEYGEWQMDFADVAD